ncbi:MAG: Grx4 family monothiol glutaredoxin [Chromatiales bacterium]|nr:Grx4 family monothiol glutaredoxin [Chromatiales bacterium]
MSLDPQTRQTIESLLNENPVVLFMKGNRGQPQCGFSAKAISALDMLVPDYLTIDVLQHADIREGIKAYGNWPTIPQLYVQGELIGGSDIIQEMFASGELAETLGVDVPAADAPAITLDESARETMQRALAGHPNMAIHLRIDAGWGHQLSLAAPAPGALSVELDGLRLQIDPWSATRAEGLRIELREDLTGTAFAFDNPNAPPPVRPLTVQDLSQRLDAGEPVYLFDVRRDDERAVAVIPGARPWNAETDRMIASLPKDTPLLFHCHHGSRSRAAAERYRRQGYTEVYNVEGGIDAWSTEIDPSVPRY